MGWSLAHAPRSPGVTGALRRAAGAIASAHRPGGWGYNRRQTTDADSTAWGWRFLAAVGGTSPSSTAELKVFLDVGGSAHTFLTDDAGSWGDAHPDVTPVVGLALLATAAEPATIRLIRAAVLRARGPDGIWPAFWWDTDSYATAWSVEFLARSGGVPPGIAAEVAAWAPDFEPDAEVIEIAHRLLATLAVEAVAGPADLTLVDALLDRSGGPTGWPSSAALLVPRKDDAPGGTGPHRDGARLMSTAIATAALARWVDRSATSRQPHSCR